MDEKVHVGSDRPKRKWSVERPVVIVAVVVALVIIAVSVVVYLLQHRPSPAVKQAQAGFHTTTYEKGDYKKAYDDLKKIEGETKNKAQQVSLYGDLASAATNDGKLAEAIRYYELRHKLDSNTIAMDALSLGALYERLNKRPEALAQYRLALEYAKAHKKASSNTDVAGIEARIKELESAP